MRTLVKELKEKVGQTVTLYLTLETLRDQKHLQFILGKDKSGVIQLVISKDKVVNHEEISTLLEGSTFIVTGKAVEAKQSKTFGIEIQVDTLEVMSKAQSYPIAEDSSIDLRFDYRVVDLKTERNQLMLKLRSAFLQGCREYLEAHDFTQIVSPKLLGVASESGSEVFSVKYFEQTAYLAQSPQFYKEAAIASGLEAVYEQGPVFRAEKSSGTRHLCEFTGLDVEVAWIFETQEIMKIEEDMMIFSLARLEPFRKEVKELYGIELTTHPRVKYLTLDEAKAILKEHGIKLGKEEDLPDHGEKMLYEILEAELIFVSDYPIAKRPFYHMWDREKGTTKSFDLIFKGIEITSGSVREHRYNEVKKQAIDKKMSLKPLKHFMDSHLYSMPPHAGFGLGVERVISRLLGITVKESAMFVRDPERLTP